MRAVNRITGVPIKIRRKDLCRRGSNRKLKHCCLPGTYRAAQIEREIMINETEKKEPSNEFREELEAKVEAERDPVEVETENVGDEEMMRRDTFATMRSLQVQRVVLAMDRAHATAAGMYYKAFIDELRELPVSEAVVSIIKGLVEQTKGLLAASEKSVMTRVSEVMLEALVVKVDLLSATAAEVVKTTPKGPTLASDNVNDDESLDDEPDGSEEI